MTSPDEPTWAVLLATTGAPFLAYVVVKRGRRPGAALVFAVLACIGAGAGAGKVRSESIDTPVLREQIGPVRLEGIIAEIDSNERNRRIRVAVRAIEGLAPGQTPKFVRFSYRGDVPFSPGRAVACSAILSPPPRPVVPGDYAFHRDAYFQQLGAVGFATGKCEPLPTPPPSTELERIGYWIGAVRRAIATHVFGAAGADGGGMAAAMVSGDRSFITSDDAEALRLSGLAHLLSISGVHMVLVGGVVFFAIRMLWPLVEPLALRIPSVRAAALGAIVACSLYFAISGAEVATQRAYIMALIAFGAKLFDRPALSLRSVAVALAVVVLLQPESVVTPGFQMSFAASASLIALYEVWPRLDRPKRPGLLARLGPWAVGTIATSVVASMATLPFALHHFDRAALFSVVANIVSTPIISLWTTPSAIAAAVAAPLGLDEPFLWLMGKSLEWVMAIARWSVEVSPKVDPPRMGAAEMALSALGIAIFCVASRRGRAFAAVPVAAAVTLWLSGSQPVGYVADDGSVFLKAERGWLELVDWRADNGLNPLIIGDDIAKAPCPGKGMSCWLDVPAGQFSFSEIGPRQSGGRCPANVALAFAPATGGGAAVNPCDYVDQGGAVLELAGGAFRIRTPQQQSGRAWTQPLYQRTLRRPDSD